MWCNECGGICRAGTRENHSSTAGRRERNDSQSCEAEEERKPREGERERRWTEEEEEEEERLNELILTKAQCRIALSGRGEKRGGRLGLGQCIDFVFARSQGSSSGAEIG